MMRLASSSSVISLRIADVDRSVTLELIKRQMPLDEVVDVHEGPRLRAVTVDGERLAAERLGHERGNRAAVVEPHLRPWVLKMRTMRVEMPCVR